MSIPQVEFDANAIRLERIFDNTEKMGYVNDGLVCEKVNNVYGKLMFGEVPEPGTEGLWYFPHYKLQTDASFFGPDAEFMMGYRGCHTQFHRDTSS